MHRTSAGFTLIETVTAMSIAMVLAGAAYPAMTGLIERTRAETLVNQLTTDLALARTTAISSGKAVTVCPTRDRLSCAEDSDWSYGWLVFVDHNRNRRIDDGDATVAIHQATGRRVKVRSTSGRETTRYLPDGLASGANLTLSFCIGGKPHSQLVMNNAGRVRVERRPPPSTAAFCEHE